MDEERLYGHCENDQGTSGSVKMKWRRYTGSRIEVEGWRTSIELPPSQQFGPIEKRNACIWVTSGKYFGYIEVDSPGELIDEQHGPFETLEQAKGALELLLLQTYPFAYEVKKG